MDLMDLMDLGFMDLGFACFVFYGFVAAPQVHDDGNDDDSDQAYRFL